ncbi:hypothetical protein BJV78DRAFT_261478 [Lactifluus subvellereus]|nr:hypothetical protein BJV78DRAFT_261478 [Lactifluus subvellereus]
MHDHTVVLQTLWETRGQRVHIPRGCRLRTPCPRPAASGGTATLLEPRNAARPSVPLPSALPRSFTRLATQSPRRISLVSSMLWSASCYDLTLHPHLPRLSRPAYCTYITSRPSSCFMSRFRTVPRSVLRYCFGFFRYYVLRFVSASCLRGLTFRLRTFYSFASTKCGYLSPWI